jgi:guanylate kinase
MIKGVCLILSAPSGGGKTTIIRAIMERFPNVRHSISYTTRNPRNDRSDLNDYHFISIAEFTNLVEDGEFLEWANVHGHRYGTRRRDLQELLAQGFDVVLDIDVQGSMLIRPKMPEAAHVFIMPPSLEVLENRLRARASESESDIRNRLHNALMEMKAYRNYDFVVINDDLDSTVDSIRSILISERCRVSRLEQKFDWELPERKESA